MRWITLKWADKFREILKNNKNDTQNAVMQFLVYIQEKETELNFSIQNQAAELEKQLSEEKL